MKKQVATSFSVIFLILFYAFQNYYPHIMYLFSNIFPIFISGVALFSAFLALKKYYGKFGSRFSIIWIGIFIGLIFWFLGEFTWGIYTLFSSSEIPYPSIADVFWIIGYIPILFGLLLYTETFRKIIPNIRIIGITVLTMVFIISIISIFMPIIIFEENLIKLIFDLAYPILDMLLIYAALLGIAIFFKGKIWKIWIMLCLGFICYGIADILFSYTTIIGIYYYGNPLEILFHLGYILLALAFHEHIKEF